MVQGGCVKAKGEYGQAASILIFVAPDDGHETVDALGLLQGDGLARVAG